MKSTFPIYTIADEPFFARLLRLITSIRLYSFSPREINVLDVGLSLQNVRKLTALGINILSTGKFENEPQTHYPYRIKSSLVDYVGDKPFIFLDADTWIQSHNFFHSIEKNAIKNGIAYVSWKKDKGYFGHMHPATYTEKRIDWYTTPPCIDNYEKYIKHPMINSGVFAGYNCFVLLQNWKSLYNKYSEYTTPSVREQITLEVALIEAEKFNSLPVTYNFLPLCATAEIHDGIFYHNGKRIQVIHNLLRSCTHVFPVKNLRTGRMEQHKLIPIYKQKAYNV